jgi:hypothetical protein
MKSLLALVAAILVSAAAHAAPPTDESVDALLTAMRAQQNIEAMLPAMEQMTRQAQGAATAGKALSAEQQRVMDAVAARLFQVIREELSWSNMRPVYLQIYRESFTQEEVDGVLAFYTSPAGIAFVEKMPLVMQKSTELMQGRMAPMIKRIRAEMQQALAEARGSGR